MNVIQIVRQIDAARAQGVRVAIEMPREGFWLDPDDLLEDRDGDLYWEHVGGYTFLVPPALVILRFEPTP